MLGNMAMLIELCGLVRILIKFIFWASSLLEYKKRNPIEVYYFLKRRRFDYFILRFTGDTRVLNLKNLNQNDLIDKFLLDELCHNADTVL